MFILFCVCYLYLGRGFLFLGCFGLLVVGIKNVLFLGDRGVGLNGFWYYLCWSLLGDLCVFVGIDSGLIGLGFDVGIGLRSVVFQGEFLFDILCYKLYEFRF